MFRLMYVSTARNLMSKETLLDILGRARDKNTRLGITGMLLYKDGNFMQLLEGEEAKVRALYETIAKDDRHHDSTILYEDSVQGRMFEAWSMGLRDLGDSDLQSLPGFSPFKNLDFSHAGKYPEADVCLEILQFFKESR